MNSTLQFQARLDMQAELHPFQDKVVIARQPP